jgi:hypothetical protein
MSLQISKYMVIVLWLFLAEVKSMKFEDQSGNICSIVERNGSEFLEVSNQKGKRVSQKLICYRNSESVVVPGRDCYSCDNDSSRDREGVEKVTVIIYQICRILEYD